ncbi:AAA family ATPase [bacterium]|nr:AAA family ATPase [bacterium]
MDLPQYLEDSEIRQLLSAATDSRDEAILVLVLSTGLFLSELLALDVASVDFENKQLHVSGKRERILELSDPAIKALADWLNDRPKTPETALFVTERGIPKRLSERSIDHIIRTTAKAAELDANYHSLRNTFIVRLLSKPDMSRKAAAKLLGIDRETLDRFDPLLAQQSSPHAQIDPFDTRSPLKKLVDVIHPKSPPVFTNGPSPIEVDCQSDVPIGREKLIAKATQLIHNNQSVLFTGPPGIGKTHLLKALQKTIPNSVWIASPTPFKSMLLELAKTLCPDTHLNQRASAPDIVAEILSADCLVVPILIIDNIDRLKASDEDIMMQLIDRFPILSAAETQPNRLQSLWWKFKEVEVPPLDLDSVRQLISHCTRTHSMNPTDYQLLETKIVNLANGNPFAVIELISQLPASKKVTTDHVRQIDHEAGIVYRDWTGALMIFWAGLVISRFVALGVHSFEGYILAGIGTTMFTLLKYFGKVRR